MKAFTEFVTERKLTLQFHQELNPKFWDENDSLDPLVRSKILEIAEAWRDYAKIPKSAVKDIYMLGGNCNYNYTRYSDVDIHLVVDMDKISSDKDLLFDYFMDKKNLWSNDYNVTIYGYPVEIFAQSYLDEPKEGQGVYSVKKDEWIQKPSKEDLSRYRKVQINHKVTFYKALINKAIKGEATADEVHKLKEKIRTMRKAGIEQGGEYAFENLVFKELRNRGLLDKLNDYKIKVIDTELSLGEYDE